MGEALLNILVIDDDEDDVFITRDLLSEVVGTRYAVDWEADQRAGMTRLVGGGYDACLLDYRLGAETGLELLKEAVSSGCETPIIILTGQGDREIDLEAMEAGAADYLVKSQLNAPLLERSIRYAIERARSERRLTMLAQYDHLTGLPNRSLLQDRLQQSLSLALRDNRCLAVLFLDLDRFKIINDTLGHSVGDMLLQSVAERLNHCVEASELGLEDGQQVLCDLARRMTGNLRSSDTVARLGGDEFVIVLSAVARAEDAALVANRILNEIRKPISLSDREIITTASIGIALAPSDACCAEDLVRYADAAMYQAKAQGGNASTFYSHNMNERALVRLGLESDLRRALERNEFYLEYQPKFNVRTRTMSGMEALLRWEKTPGERISPAVFIPILEEIGLINDVGEWVIHQAGTDLNRWINAGQDPVPIAVNVSGLQLKRPDFLDNLREELAWRKVDPRLFELELTESVLMKDVEETIRKLQLLQELGISVSIDDFGTGYSSLSYLKNFPVKKLKIDTSFIRNIGKDPGDEAITKAIVDLARHLGKEVVAEGVETEAQFAYVRSLGCEEAQGYLLGRPTRLENLFCQRRATGSSGV